MPEKPMGSTGDLALGDYLRVVWRWKWMILITVCTATAAAYFYSYLQPAQYMATASIMYVEPVDPSNPLGSNSYYYSDTRDIAVENMITLMQSPEVGGRAEDILEDIEVGAYDVSTAVTGGADEGSGGVIDISATSEGPDTAAAVANAYAEAAVDWSKAQQLGRIEVAIAAVKAKLESFTTEESRLTTDYIMLKQQLQNLQLLETTTEGDFQLIAQAYPPTEPFAPQPTRAAALGLGVGLLTGVGLAFLLNLLGTRVRGKREAGEALGLAVIGTVPEIDRRTLNEGALIALTHPNGPAAEALRLVRSNLDYLNVDDATSLLVTSALAGEGKSLTACNLAVTMAMAGRRVAIVDGDLRRPRVHEYFELPNEAGLSSVAAGDVTLREALIRIDLPPAARPGESSQATSDVARRVKVNLGVTVGEAEPAPDARATEHATANRSLVALTAGPFVSDPGELVASEQFGRIIRALQDDGMDLVIVDAPPLMEVGDAAAMAAEVEALVVVVDFKKARQETLLETRHILHPLPCKKLGVILVKTRDGTSGYGYYS